MFDKKLEASYAYQMLYTNALTQRLIELETLYNSNESETLIFTLHSIFLPQNMQYKKYRLIS